MVQIVRGGFVLGFVAIAAWDLDGVHASSTTLGRHGEDEDREQDTTILTSKTITVTSSITTSTVTTTTATQTRTSTATTTSATTSTATTTTPRSTSTATATTTSITTSTATITTTLTTGTLSALRQREEEKRQEQIVGGVVGGAVGALGVGILGGILGAITSTTLAVGGDTTTMQAVSIITDAATSTMRPAEPVGPVGGGRNASAMTHGIDKSMFGGLHHEALLIAAAAAALVAVGLCLALRHLAKHGRHSRIVTRSKSFDDESSMGSPSRRSLDDESFMGSPSRRPLAPNGSFEEESMSPYGNNNPDESRQAQHGTASHVSASQANAVFDTIDRNHDGVISRSEIGEYFRTAYANMQPLAGYTLPLPVQHPVVAHSRVMVPQWGAQAAMVSPRIAPEPLANRHVNSGIHW